MTSQVTSRGTTVSRKGKMNVKATSNQAQAVTATKSKKDERRSRIAAEIEQGGKDLKRAIAGINTKLDAPAPAKGKKASVIHYKGDKAVTLCGIWNPSANVTDRADLVTCKTCLAALNPKAKAKRERKPDVTIKCSTCGAKRVVPASQAHTVTRCKACQAAYLKGKRREKNKAHAKNRKLEVRLIAREILADLQERSGPEGERPEVLRALATIIREEYPKAKK